MQFLILAVSTTTTSPVCFLFPVTSLLFCDYNFNFLLFSSLQLWLFNAFICGLHIMIMIMRWIHQFSSRPSLECLCVVDSVWLFGWPSSAVHVSNTIHYWDGGEGWILCSIELYSVDVSLRYKRRSLLSYIQCPLLSPFTLPSLCPAQGQALYTVAGLLLRQCQNISLSVGKTHTSGSFWFVYHGRFILPLSSDLVFQIVEQGKNAKSYHYILANLVRTHHCITAF